MNLGVAILAAGLSTRMGRPKMLLPWAGTTVIGHLIAQWQALAASQIAVVCGAGDSAMQIELDRLSFSAKERILNPEPEAEMFSSIQCAARWTGWDAGSLKHLALALGDQPHLKNETLRSLLAFCENHPRSICMPRHAGHRRHPVILPFTVLGRLANWPSTNLRHFLDAIAPQTAIMESDDAGLALDIDRPADYARALQEFGGSGGALKPR